MRVRIAVLLLLLTSLAGCSSSGTNDNGFALIGDYLIEWSGTEGGEVFITTGTMTLDTVDNMVTGTWEMDGPPPTILSGTLTGMVERNNFEFVMESDIPSLCGDDYDGQATVVSFREFSGIVGGGCPGLILSANFATIPRR